MPGMPLSPQAALDRLSETGNGPVLAPALIVTITVAAPTRQPLLSYA
jgi:hypothetical protein